MCPIELLQALGLDNEKMHRRLAQPHAGKPILEVLERFGNGQPLSPAHHATKVFWLGRMLYDDHRAAVYEMAFVHVLARMGKLPEDFKDWRSCREKDTGFTVAHAAAQACTLPAGFKDWGLADEDSWTVAHHALTRGPLPADFKRWEMASWAGYTVAHLAAQVGRLPENFKDWLLVFNGQTVAHDLVRCGKQVFPPGFDLWHLENHQGVSVIDHARACGRLDIVAQHETWRLQSAMKDTEEDAPISSSRIHRHGV